MLRGNLVVFTEGTSVNDKISSSTWSVSYGYRFGKIKVLDICYAFRATGVFAFILFKSQCETGVFASIPFKSLCETSVFFSPSPLSPFARLASLLPSPLNHCVRLASLLQSPLNHYVRLASLPPPPSPLRPFVRLASFETGVFASIPFKSLCETGVFFPYPL